MTRWLGAGFGACEGEAYGGDGHGEECRDAQVAGDVPSTADVKSEASALLIASFTQYVGTKCATVCTAGPISDRGIQRRPKTS